MIGNAELLLRTNPPRDERETRLVDLIREAQRAARLVDDLLLITRLDTPQPTTLRRQPVALTDIADRAITLARLRRPDRSIALTPAAATDTTVSGDPDHLHRALTNLLDNATTATTPGGHVTLTITTPQARYASPSPTPAPVSPSATNTASSTASSASTPPAPAQHRTWTPHRPRHRPRPRRRPPPHTHPLRGRLRPHPAHHHNPHHTKHHRRPPPLDSDGWSAGLYRPASPHSAVRCSRAERAT